MKRALLFCALAAFAFSVGSARAAEFTISFTSASGLGFSGTGTFDASSLGGGLWQITGVESGGSVTDPGALGFGTSAITGINTDFGADNDLSFPAGAEGFFDANGITFGLANGFDVNLFANDNGDGTFSPAALLGNANNATDGEFINVSVSPATAPPAATPEPGSLALLGTSVLGAAGLLRRRIFT